MVIVVGRLNAEESRPNRNGSQWIRGRVGLHRSSGHMLRDIRQSYCPFEIVTKRPLPKGMAILIGDWKEWQPPNTLRIWRTFVIKEVFTESDDVIKRSCKRRGISFSELLERAGRGDKGLCKELMASKGEVMERLKELLGKQNTFADQMWNLFGAHACDVLEKNPWEMINVISNFTITKADAVAEKLGIPLDDPRRFQEYFHYLLEMDFQGKRDTYLTEGEFWSIYWGHFMNQMKPEAYKEQALGAKGAVKVSAWGYHPIKFWKAEARSFDFVKAALEDQEGVSKEEERYAKQVEAAMPFSLTKEQCYALRNALTGGIFCITGGPGTGKTTILRAILQKLMKISGQGASALLMAPTGRAACRMQEQTGFGASTIHSALGIAPGKGVVNVMETVERLSGVRYVIIDEASMLDTLLFGDICHILQNMNPVPRLLLVGDVDQLQPVQHGQVFLDILSFLERYAPKHVARLTVVKRQSEGSSIPELAHYLRHGQFPDAEWFRGRSDVFFAQTTAKDLSDTLINRVLLPKADELDQIQIITPYRNGDLMDTTFAINNLAKPIFNPNVEREESIMIGETVFHVGDRVINRINLTSDVVNGSIGVITKIKKDEHDPLNSWIEVEFETETYTLDYEQMQKLELAYAITVHASQGSEYANVVVPIVRGNVSGDFLNRNLLYVAVTRAKEKLVLLGRPETFGRIAAMPRKVRKTALAKWLEQLEGE